MPRPVTAAPGTATQGLRPGSAAPAVTSVPAARTSGPAQARRPRPAVVLTRPWTKAPTAQVREETATTKPAAVTVHPYSRTRRSGRKVWLVMNVALSSARQATAAGTPLRSRTVPGGSSRGSDTARTTTATPTAGGDHVSCALPATWSTATAAPAAV